MPTSKRYVLARLRQREKLICCDCSQSELEGGICRSEIVPIAVDQGAPAVTSLLDQDWKWQESMLPSTVSRSAQRETREKQHRLERERLGVECRLARVMLSGSRQTR